MMSSRKKSFSFSSILLGVILTISACFSAQVHAEQQYLKLINTTTDPIFVYQRIIPPRIILQNAACLTSPTPPSSCFSWRQVGYLGNNGYLFINPTETTPGTPQNIPPIYQLAQAQLNENDSSNPKTSNWTALCSFNPSHITGTNTLTCTGAGSIFTFSNDSSGNSGNYTAYNVATTTTTPKNATEIGIQTSTLPDIYTIPTAISVGQLNLTVLPIMYSFSNAENKQSVLAPFSNSSQPVATFTFDGKPVTLISSEVNNTPVATFSMTTDNMVQIKVNPNGNDALLTYIYPDRKITCEVSSAEAPNSFTLQTVGDLNHDNSFLKPGSTYTCNPFANYFIQWTQTSLNQAPYEGIADLYVYYDQRSPGYAATWTGSTNVKSQFPDGIYLQLADGGGMIKQTQISPPLDENSVLSIDLPKIYTAGYQYAATLINTPSVYLPLSSYPFTLAPLAQWFGTQCPITVSNPYDNSQLALRWDTPLLTQSSADVLTKYPSALSYQVTVTDTETSAVHTMRCASNTCTLLDNLDTSVDTTYHINLSANLNLQFWYIPIIEENIASCQYSETVKSTGWHPTQPTILSALPDSFNGTTATITYTPAIYYGPGVAGANTTQNSPLVTSNDSNCSEPGYSQLSDNAYQLNGLTSGCSYTVHMQAVNSDAPQTAHSLAAPLDMYKLNKGASAVTAVQSGTDSLQINWQEASVSPADSNINYQVCANSTCQNSTTNTATISNLTPGNKYTIKVTASADIKTSADPQGTNTTLGNVTTDVINLVAINSPDEAGIKHTTDANIPSEIQLSWPISTFSPPDSPIQATDITYTVAYCDLGKGSAQGNSPSSICSDNMLTRTISGGGTDSSFANLTPNTNYGFWIQSSYQLNNNTTLTSPWTTGITQATGNYGLGSIKIASATQSTSDPSKATITFNQPKLTPSDSSATYSYTIQASGTNVLTTDVTDAIVSLKPGKQNITVSATATVGNVTTAKITSTDVHLDMYGLSGLAINSFSVPDPSKPTDATLTFTKATITPNATDTITYNACAYTFGNEKQNCIPASCPAPSCVVGSVSGTDATFNLKAGQQYVPVITANVTVNNIPLTESVSDTTPAKTYSLSAPTITKVSQSGTDSLTVDWNKAAPIPTALSVSYVVKACETGASPCNTTDTTNNSITLNNLSAGNYTITVNATASENSQTVATNTDSKQATIVAFTSAPTVTVSSASASKFNPTLEITDAAVSPSSTDIQSISYAVRVCEGTLTGAPNCTTGSSGYQNLTTNNSSYPLSLNPTIDQTVWVREIASPSNNTAFQLQSNWSEPIQVDKQTYSIVTPTVTIEQSTTDSTDAVVSFTSTKVNPPTSDVTYNYQLTITPTNGGAVTTDSYSTGGTYIIAGLPTGQYNATLGVSASLNNVRIASGQSTTSPFSMYALNPPTGLMTDADSVTTDSATVSWTDASITPPGSSGLNISYMATATPSAGGDSISGTVTGNQASFSTLTPHTTYDVKVTASAGYLGSESISGKSLFTTQDLPLIASMPTPSNNNMKMIISGNQTLNVTIPNATFNEDTSGLQYKYSIEFTSIRGANQIPTCILSNTNRGSCRLEHPISAGEQYSIKITVTASEGGSKPQSVTSQPGEVPIE